MTNRENDLLIEKWYKQYSTFLFHYACQFIDYHAAEEVVQESFRIAWEVVQKKEIEYPKTWLRKVAENVVKNKIREREKWRELLSDIEKLPEDVFGQVEDPVNVELEYNGLIDQQDLHLLRLLAVDGYTYTEAAKKLCITAEACRKRAKRAEQKLREFLK